MLHTPYEGSAERGWATLSRTAIPIRNQLHMKTKEEILDVASNSDVILYQDKVHKAAKSKSNKEELNKLIAVQSLESATERHFVAQDAEDSSSSDEVHTDSEQSQEDVEEDLFSGSDVDDDELLKLFDSDED